jgi:hypothetical protein
MFYSFCVLLLLALVSADQIVIVTKDSHGAFKAVWGEQDVTEWYARARFSDAEDHPSFFGQLEVKTNPSMPANEAGFAAGYAEGALTADHIYNMWLNERCLVDCSGEPDEQVNAFFIEQERWAEEQIEAHPDCSYWQTVDFVFHQYRGLQAGYNEHASEDKQLGTWSFRVLNGMGDLFDIMPAVSQEKRPAFHRMSYREIVDYMNKNGHCSALIKVSESLDSLWMAHSSWFTYSSMLRIYKMYQFALPQAATQLMAFSSYPGMLSSLDDFYMMDSGLFMTQTTNSILNATLWDDVEVDALLAWQRVRVSHALASSGPEWLSTFGKHNSGTYANQYMIVDTNLFVPGQALQPNLLTIVEQNPGLVVGGDATGELERGYFPSYNVPYFDAIYLQSGYGDVDSKNQQLEGTQYQLAPRARIFRRDQNGVQSFYDMKHIMRYNDYQNDPVANGDPWSAICSRGDLSPSSPSASGCYDTKVTSFEYMKEMKAEIVNGPTAQGLPPFSWATSGLASSNDHYGQPDEYNFEFELVQPSSFLMGDE